MPNKYEKSEAQGTGAENLAQILPPWLSRLWNAASQHYARGGAHGVDHAIRVYQYALLLDEYNCANKIVVSIAALVHDIGRTQKGDHAAVGAQFCDALIHAWLPELDTETCDMVVHCIRVHRQRFMCSTIESQLLWDADKLDILGPHGILRMAMRSGEMGSPLERQNTGAGESLLSVLHSKVRSLGPAMFFTEKAKALALPRHRFLQHFLSDVTRLAVMKSD